MRPIQGHHLGLSISARGAYQARALAFGRVKTESGFGIGPAYPRERLYAALSWPVREDSKLSAHPDGVTCCAATSMASARFSIRLRLL